MIQEIAKVLICTNFDKPSVPGIISTVTTKRRERDQGVIVIRNA
jgi:hypothetical protein